jgi:prophage antirepressor-like protein
MNNLQIFTNNELNVSVETITLNDIVYFNARHMADALEIVDHTSSFRDFANDELVKLTNELVFSNPQTMRIRNLNNAGENFLTEAGVYKAIFQSRSPKSKIIQRWVFHEVLPSIRKHGMYATPVTLERMIADPRWAAGLLVKLAEEKEAKELAEKEALLANEFNKELRNEIGQGIEYAAVKKVLILAIKAPKITT